MSNTPSRFRLPFRLPRRKSPTSPAVRPTSPVVPSAAVAPSPSTVGSSSSVPLPHITNPDQQGERFFHQALLELTPQEQDAIQKHVVHGGQDVSKAVELAYNAAVAQRQLCEDKRWQWTFHGRTITLRDEADKVVRFLDRFKSIGDVVANVDPVHVGLPWAGIRTILQVAVGGLEERAAALVGLDLALWIAIRLQVYFGYFVHLPPTLAKQNFERGLVKLYALVLQFLASAIVTCEKSTAIRALKALWQEPSLVGFEEKCDQMAVRVQEEARLCEQELSLRQWEEIAQWRQTLEKQLQNISKIHDIADSLAGLHDKVDLSRLHAIAARGATYDSFEEGEFDMCLEGTRVELLRQISQWADDVDGKSIFWLCGKAGTGKSAVSRTVAHTFDKKRYCLGASFFFKRGEGDRGGAKRFFPTIAEQLANRIPGMRHSIALALDKEPQLCEKSLETQLDALIVQPLLDAAQSRMSHMGLFVVVDALDECENGEHIRTLLSLLSHTQSTGSVRLRLFVTSRPELPIQLGFRDMEKNLHDNVYLEEVQQSTIEHDIRMYLDHQLLKIKSDYLKLRKYNKLPEVWPEEGDVRTLVELAVPLFICAVTICRFVSQSNPSKRLELVLLQGSKGSYSGLKKTYMPVLDQLLWEREAHEGEQIIEDFRKVVGAIVLLADPLSITSLTRLLDVDLDETADLLDHLHAVLHVPADLHTPIRTLHLSFREFLVDERKKSTNKFWVDQTQTHRRLAEHCLRLLNSPGALKQDICDVQKPGTRRAEVSREQVARSIPADVAYACVYWISHAVEQ